MRRALLTSLSALALASCASARTLPGVHGPIPYAPVPSTMAITFGAETLAGYGGYHLAANTTFTGLLNASAALSSDFILDTSGDIVPRGLYGTSPPTFNGPYTASLSDGVTNGVVTIQIAPNTSTVKSHYGFAAGSGPDTPSSFQLENVLKSANNIHLGDTLIVRAGSGETGATPALNPLNLSTLAGGTSGAQRYFLTAPIVSGALTYTTGSGSYAPGGTPRIKIQCESANAGIDANGNAIEGGPCDAAVVIGAASDVALPWDFYDFHFYNNHPVGSGLSPIGSTPASGLFYYSGATGHGVNVYASRFEYGPAITSAYERVFALALAQARLGTWDSDHFVGGWVGVQGIDSQDVSTPWTISNSTFEQMTSDALDITTNTGSPDLLSNFIFNFKVGNQNPSDGDGFTIGSNGYSFSTASPAALAPFTVPISPSPYQTVLNTVCTINAGGSIPVGGGTTGVPASTFVCVAGVNYPNAESPDGNATASILAPTYPTYSLKVTALAASVAIHTVNGTYGTSSASGLSTAASSIAWSVQTLAATGSIGTLTFSTDHSDTFQILKVNAAANYRAGRTAYNISVRNIDHPNNGFRQFYLGNPLTACCMVGALIENNIDFNTAGNAVYLEEFNNPTVQANTTLSDAASSSWAPSDPTYDTINQPTWYNTMSRLSEQVTTLIGGVPVASGGGGGTFVNNLANSWSWSGQTTVAQPAPNNLAAGTVAIADNEALDWLSSSPPLTGSPVVAWYQTIFPTLPSGQITSMTNRAAVLGMFKPVVGSTFGGTISSVGSNTLTVVSGSAPPVNTAINGPGIPYGDIVLAVSGSTVTLQWPSTATETAQTYATGALNPDGTYTGAEFPNGCWNDLSVYNPATACAAAQ